MAIVNCMKSGNNIKTTSSASGLVAIPYNPTGTSRVAPNNNLFTYSQTSTNPLTIIRSTSETVSGGFICFKKMKMTVKVSNTTNVIEFEPYKAYFVEAGAVTLNNTNHYYYGTLKIRKCTIGNYLNSAAGESLFDASNVNNGTQYNLELILEEA